MNTFRYPTAEAAEAAFYAAFEANDLDAMMQVWDNTEDVICVHPMGPILRGSAAVMASWRDIFSGGARMHFSIETIQTYSPPHHAMHIVTEHIEVPGSKRVAPMSAINMYRHTSQGWRMIAHHAGPAVAVDVDNPQQPNPVLH